MATKNYGERVATQLGFEPTRRNTAEFGRAASSGKLLTDAFRAITDGTSDARQQQRLLRAMYKVIKSDQRNEPGQRKVSAGNLQLLMGFNFNVDAKLYAVFPVSFKAAIDRVTGTLKVDIPAFIPRKTLQAPRSATHFSIVCGAAELNFDTATQKGVHGATAKLVYGKEPTEAIGLSYVLTPNSTDVLVLVLGVTFYLHANGRYHQLYDGRYNAVAIIQVDVPNP